jgi:hypothetical protein
VSSNTVTGFANSAARQAAYPLALGDMILVPHLGLHDVRLDKNKFSESGRQFLPRDASRTMPSRQPSTGVSLLSSFAASDRATLIPSLKASYAHELLGTPWAISCSRRPAARPSTPLAYWRIIP